MTPLIGVTCLAVILASWLGGYRYPGGIPGGLMAIIVGAIIAWGGQLVGFDLGGIGPQKVSAARRRLRLPRAAAGVRRRSSRGF